LILEIVILIAIEVVGQESELQQKQKLQQMNWELLSFPLFRKYPQAEGRYIYIDPEKLKEFVKTIGRLPNPSKEDVKNKMIEICKQKKIPPHILFAVAWAESEWKQFNAQGYAIVSPDGGLGMMQLTDETLVDTVEKIAGKTWVSDGKGWTNDKDLIEAIAQLAKDWQLNLEHGAEVLLEKWNNLSSKGITIGDKNDLSVIEHWYYVVWAYNAFSYTNNPNNTDTNIINTYWRISPLRKVRVPYQEYVFDIIQLGSEDGYPWDPISDLWRPSKEQIGNRHPPRPVPVIPIMHKDTDFDGKIDETIRSISISSVEPSPQSVNAGNYINIVMKVENFQKETKTLLFGASLKAADGTRIDDPNNDILVKLPPGEAEVERKFHVPVSAKPGDYDLLVALWEDEDGNGKINSGDRSIILKVLLQAIKVTAPVSVTFRYPLGDGYTPPEVTGKFGGSVPELKLYGHLGEDYKAAEGTPVYAVADGIIVSAGGDPNKGWGYYILIKHTLPDGTAVLSLYAHLSEILKRNGKVRIGELIAKSGETGRVTGPHLHFGILDSSNYTPGKGYAGYEFDESLAHIQVDGRTYYNPSKFIEKWKGVTPTLQILYPTPEQVANAGPYNKPAFINAKVKVFRGQNPIHGLKSENFAVLIGEEKASVTALEIQQETGKNQKADTYYYLNIKPPKQPKAGKYDLIVRYVCDNQVIAEAEKKEAIEYIDPTSGTGKVELVLILDSSGSMSWNDPNDTRKDYAKRFINFAREGDYIGIVDFDEDAVILANLTKILTNDQREELKLAIDRIDSQGSTNIEDGLWKGLQVLGQGEAGNIKVAILLTDGEHNTGPIGDAIKQYTQRGIRLYTIALTGEADEALLRSYAEQTGGRYLKAPTAAELGQIWQEIIGAAIGERPILTASFTMKQGDMREQPIPVDSAQEVLVAGITWPGSNVKLTLIRPDGSAVDPNTDTTVEYNRGSDFEIYRVHSPAAGQWTARIEAIEAPDTGTQVKLTVATTTSLVAEAFPLKTTYFTGEAIVVAVSLFEGDQPVIGAQVEAKITKPDGKISRTRRLSDAKVERDAQGRIAKLEINVLNRQAGTFDEILPLFDDGLHNDGAANDGVYANIYKATTKEGTYIFNITATGTDSKGFPFRRELIVTTDVSGTAPALFEVTPAQIDLGIIYVGQNGAISMEQLVRIVNQSNETQSVLITSTELLGFNGKRIPGGYLSVSPSQFVLDPGAEATISLNLDLPISVESGEYAGNLVLSGNTQNQQVPLRFKVETDSEKPRIQDLRPVSGSVLIGPQILTMTVYEAQAGILFDKVKVFVDGQEAVTDISYDSDTRVLAIELWLPEPTLEGFTPLPPGHHKITIEVPDRALNTEILTMDLEIAQPPSLPSGIGIFTIPFEFSDPSVSAVLVNAGFPAVVWDTQQKKYVPFTQTTLGQAFWAKFADAFTPEFIQRGISPMQTEPYAVPLKSGWNLIATPFLREVLWDVDRLHVRKGMEEKTLRQAQQAGWVEDYAWGWEQDANNPNTGRYVLIYDTNIIPGVKGQLEPWKGYWVYAHTDCELILPPPSQSKGRGTRDRGQVAKGNGWSMRLQASVNGSVGEAVIGIANGTRGLAVGLPPEPPTGNNGIQVILLKNNTPLAVDVRSDGSRKQEWEVLVRWDRRQVTRGMGERKEVVLTFDGIGYAPKDVSAWLVDTVTGKRLYLRTQPSYRFVAQEGEVERKFKVIVEKGNDRPLRVIGLKATPMRGQGVVIEFSLTKPAKVEVEVLTLTGRRVAVLDTGSGESLTRRIVWRGVGIEGQKVGSGVYLVRVRAVDEEGREVQAATAVRLR
jgi:murein DD-endopeptidase MepM/ murein hydrolase activator NlpD